jgi:hypothetical protein
MSVKPEGYPGVDILAFIIFFVLPSIKYNEKSSFGIAGNGFCHRFAHVV